MKKRLLALFLLSALTLSLVGCGEEPKVPAGQEGPFTLSAPYRIVVGENYKNNDDISDAVSLLTAALKDVCGITVQSGDDTGEKDYDILVGPTAREETGELQKTLKVNDYGYTVPSEQCIVFAGGTTEGVVKAVTAFCADVLGYKNGKGEAKTVTLTPGLRWVEQGQYPYDEASLRGIDLKDFTVVVANRALIPQAQTMVKGLGKYTGYVLPIVQKEDLTGSEKGVIVVGALDREGKNRYFAACDGYLIKTSEEDGKFTLGIAAKNNPRYQEAMEKVLKSLKPTENGDNVSVELPDTDIVEYIYEDIPKWTLKTENTETVTDGVEKIVRTYRDEKNRPYVATALILDLNKVSLTMGTTDDGVAYGPNPAGTVEEHMKSAVENGKNVIAGVNGDFFDLGGDNHPLGIAVKEGHLITRGGEERGYFAITKDGKPVIGKDAHKATLKNLQNAWGGRQMIVEKGIPANLELNTEFSDTAHPRTLVGITEDGKVILATIDGRLPSVSNGAPLAQCALYMLSLGATSALNLDGGGSTTMVLRKGDTYKTVNNLSEGAPRRVYNSILVVGK